MRIAVITPPTPIVTAAEARQWTRIDALDDDEMLDGMLAAATQWLDAPRGWLGIALGVQTLEMTFPAGAWRCGRLSLWYPPVITVTGVRYVDEAGIEHTLAADQWQLDGETVRPADGASWPAVAGRERAARVTYEAGHVEVPEPIRIAVMMLAAQWYAGREAAADKAMAEPPFAVSALVQPFRILRI